MELSKFGTDFPHAKGEFCKKMVRQCYTICCFATPFIYLRDGNFARGEAGDILINSPGHVIYHGPLPEAEQGYINDWMVVEGQDFTELLERYPLPLDQAFHIPDEHLFRKHTNRLKGEFRSSKIGSRELISSLITQMFIELHRSYTKTATVKTPYSTISAVHDKILENPEKKWTLSEMAKQSQYSVSRFSELYCQLYGKSPMDDVIEERIKLAKQLLDSGQASVSYIAEVCGFNSINYFSRYFKKRVGCTPTEYTNIAQAQKKQP